MSASCGWGEPETKFTGATCRDTRSCEAGSAEMAGPSANDGAVSKGESSVPGIVDAHDGLGRVAH